VAIVPINQGFYGCGQNKTLWLEKCFGN